MGLLDIFKKKEVKLKIEGNEAAYCMGLISMAAIDKKFDTIEVLMIQTLIKRRAWINQEDLQIHVDTYIEKRKSFSSNEEFIVACVEALDENHYKEFYFDMFTVAFSDRDIEPTESQMLKELKIILNIDDDYAAATLLALYEAFKK